MTMRRFGSRWRDASTPEQVLDIFKIGERYEVLIRNWRTDNPQDEWADGLDLADDGSRFPSFELGPYGAAGYRRRYSKRRQSWASLPEPVREAVRQWLED